ncbi:endothelin-converting enzyme Metallo peptidase. MEROPS family M13 [Sphingomonas guangdongensis]|uniref:Endothelin-converting enzyme Metallo peptidase. MEROPS family M13 n=1 Tax=Sphingomonas guangdongensis TaxID=1141890 RepID=A0A285R1B8_9SPHN|nr:M13-type metalloendopeptidase [Sphingomonas guangdongensis]SOB87891.1 endothelin-converting enzyme Metallo peptidase. MEROPS family M13 [Sphingomonas guangdongensis]
MRFSALVAFLSAGTMFTSATYAQNAPTAAPASKPEIGSFGFDTAGMDRSVAPGTSFYDYASGTWDKTTEIPADRASYGMFHKLIDRSLEQTRTILTEAAAKPGSKVGDFYASYMDEAGIEARGIAPVKPWIDALKAARTKDVLVREAARQQALGMGGLIGTGVGQDLKAPDTYIVGISQSGLSLPDRDYYLKDDPKFATVRTAYQAYLAKLLKLAGEPDGEARAAAVFGFEKSIATAHWTRVESRDADKTYNKWTFADLTARAPGYPWAAWQQGLGLAPQPSYVVRQPSAVTGEAAAFAAAPLAVLKDYYLLRVLKGSASYLPKAFDEADFAFFGTVLAGTPQQQPRWKRAVAQVSGSLGEEVGQVYVARYFPPESKAAIDQLVRNVTAAMADRLDRLEWMAPETKVKAKAKLAAFTPKIGYPDTWRDYSSVTVARDDLVGNVARANAFEFKRGLNKLGKPIDRGEWFMTPMTINAYANPPMNEIVFPAAILQPPFFDPKADPAVNYGGIGAVIGHEISHHFDDQGRKFDPTGKLADWWTPQDVERFKTFTDKLVAQYSAFEPLPGQKVNGALTLGENIADLAGLTVAYAAYQKSLNGRPAPVINGLTGDQRFFLGWAQVWRTKTREPALRQQLVSDPHSPGPQRVAMVRNLDAWYAAFGAKPGDAAFLAPADRVRIW